MSVDPTPAQAGETYRTAWDATIYVIDVSESGDRATTRVTHLGHSWDETMPLIDGALPFEADLVAGVSPVSTLTPVTTRALRFRHYLNPETGDAFCGKISRASFYNQAEADEYADRYRRGRRVGIILLPECGLCTKSPGYRRAVSGPGAVTA